MTGDDRDERVNGYAEALLAVTRGEGLVDRASSELFHFARAYETNDALRGALTNQELPVEKRVSIVEEVVGAKASPLTAALVGFLVSAGRAAQLVAIIDRFTRLAASERQHEVAEVRSAVALDADQQARVAQALSTALGKQIDVMVVVDPSVMGGLVARVGDTVIDGSVRHRLDKLRETI
ncbi:MAG TPA: ATP synthase F1 subunit delta [Acidimicrobiales bacterium]|nr:ATP synthase F1 subunit delta [Acidimicrobiales bacterium]